MGAGGLWWALVLVVVGATAAPSGCRKNTCTCPTIIAQVCGVDHVTYGNPCEADCLGVAVAHAGPCETDAGVGGANGGAGGQGGTAGAGGASVPSGCCRSSNDCSDPTNQRCSLAVASAAQGQLGVCEPGIPANSNLCWTDGDCSNGKSCSGAHACPCGAQCLLADEPGQCVSK